MGVIRNVHINDAGQLVEIYNYYVLNTITTFDDVPLLAEAFEEKINTINAGYPFLVFEEGAKIIGYAYAGKWRQKPAYKNTVEITVYLKRGEYGKQIGTKLYAELLRQLKQQKYHSIIGGMTLPNEASERLHEKFGFKQVAHFKEVGLKFGKWLDVGFWQLIFD